MSFENALSALEQAYLDRFNTAGGDQAAYDQVYGKYDEIWLPDYNALRAQYDSDPPGHPIRPA